MKKLISLLLVLVMAFTLVMPASAFELRLSGGDVPVVTIYGDGEPLYNADGTEKIFLNTTAKDLSNLDLDLRLFYDYIKGKVAQTTFTKELDKSIARMKQEKEERNMYLTYTSRMMEYRQDGYAEGREEGISIGLATGREEGISIGLEQGLERGAHQTKLETARKLITRGYAPEEIADVSGLTLSQVQELLDS